MRLPVAALVLLALAAAGSLVTQGFRINSDLQAVLPVATELQQAVIRRTSGDAGGKVLLALEGADPATLASARATLHAAVAEWDWLQLLPPDSGRFERYLEVIAAYPAGFVPADDQARLAAGDVMAWRPRIADFLYGFGDGLRVSPYARDPLNLGGRFAAGALPVSDLEPLADALRRETTRGVAFVYVLELRPAKGLDELIAARDALGELKARLDATGVHTTLSGAINHVAGAAEVGRREVTIISGLSLALVVALNIWVFGSLAALAFGLASIAFGALLAIAAAQWLFGEVHILALVFGAGLIGVGIDYSLHYLCTGDPAHRRRLGLTAFGALLTTGLAYGGLLGVDLMVVRQLAAIAVVGLAGCWLFVVALHPAWFSGALSIRSAVPGRLTSLLQQPTLMLGNRGYLVLLLVLLLVAVASLSRATLSQRVAGLYVPDPALVAADGHLQELLAPPASGRMLLVSAADPVALAERAMGLSAQLADLQSAGAIADYLLLTDALPPPAAQLQSRALLDQLYADLPALAAVTELETRTLRDNRPVAVMDEATWQAQAVDLFPGQWLGEMAGAYHLAVPLWSPDADQLALTSFAAGIRYLDMPLTWGQSLAATAQVVASALALAVLAAALLLWAWLRGSSLLVIAVPVTSALLTAALMGAAGELSLFHLLGIVLVIGLGFDYGIFLYRDQGNDDRARVAVLLSALTSAAAFGLLALSSSPMVAAFGLTVLAGCCFNILLVPGIQMFHVGRRIE